MKSINIDMDGTIADLYSIPNWLPKIEQEDASPYAEAKPMVNFSVLARYLNKLKKQGWKINIISWSSKSGTTKFNREVATVKKEWLAKHLPSVKFDRIFVVPYGTPKTKYATDGESWLFDDSQAIRADWESPIDGRIACEPTHILETLHGLSL